MKQNSDLQRYYSLGQSWDEQLISNALRSRNRAWVLVMISFVIALLCLLTLLTILPLKTFEPYVIAVDRHTSYYEVSKGLLPGDLAQDQAITESNLVRYLSLREQYNPAILRENYDQVSLMSADEALTEYRDLWSAQNPNNPSVKLGPKTYLDIKIKSVSFISDQIAQIRFLKEKKSPEGASESHWNAVIEFRYAGESVSMKERFINPLGFKVINYRINPEVLEKIQ